MSYISNIIDSYGVVNISTTAPNTELKIDGYIALKNSSSDQLAPTNYGALYTKTDNNLYFQGTNGVISQLTSGSTGSVFGSGNANQITYWNGTNIVTGNNNFTYNPSIGQLLISSNSASIPSISFDGYSTSGMYYDSGANGLALSVDGYAVAYLTNNSTGTNPALMITGSNDGVGTSGLLKIGGSTSSYPALKSINPTNMPNGLGTVWIRTADDSSNGNLYAQSIIGTNNSTSTTQAALLATGNINLYSQFKLFLDGYSSGGIVANGASYLQYDGAGSATAILQGNSGITLQNSSSNTLNLHLGSSVSSATVPSLVVNGTTTLAVRNNNNTADAPITVSNMTASGIITTSVGSASAPSYTFAGLSDAYGFYYDSTNVAVATSINGTENLYITKGQVVLPSSNSLSWAGSTSLSAPSNDKLLIASNSGTNINGVSLDFGVTASIAAPRLQAQASPPGWLLLNTAGASTAYMIGGNFLALQQGNPTTSSTIAGGPAFAMATGTGTPQQYGFGFADNVHATIYTNAAVALNIDSAQNAVFSANLTSNNHTVDGYLALQNQSSAPSTNSGFGTLYTKTSDNNLYYISGAGVTSQLTPVSGTVGGSGVAGELAYWSASTTITGSSNLTYDGIHLSLNNASPNTALSVYGDGYFSNALEAGLGVKSDGYYYGPSGTVSAPTYSFTGNTNNGMWYDSTNGGVAISYAGNESLIVSKLNVLSGGTTYGAIQITPGGAYWSAQPGVAIRLAAITHDNTSYAGVVSGGFIVAANLNGALTTSSGSAGISLASSNVNLYATSGGFVNAQVGSTIYWQINSNGGMNYQANSLSKTANYTVTTANSGTVFDSYGTTQNITFTLPAIGTNRGLIYTFLTAVDGYSITIAPNSSDTIFFNGLSLSQGASITSDTKHGTCVTLVSQDANTWEVINYVGNWGQTVTYTNITATNQILIPAGSTSTPGLAFSVETNTGIYRPAAGQIGLSVLGSQVLNIDNNTTQSIVLGASSTSTGSNAVAIGKSATSTANSVAIGTSATTSGVTTSVAIGDGATTNANNSVALGALTQTNGAQAVSLGYNVVTYGADSIGIGYNITEGTSTSLNILIGAGPKAANSTNNVIAIGQSASGNGIDAIAIGFGAGTGGSQTGAGSSAVSIGLNTSAGASSVAIGNATRTDAYTSAVSIGPSSRVLANSSIAIGDRAGIGNSANGSVGISIGELSSASGSNAIAIGGSTFAIGNQSVAVGGSVIVNGTDSVALGYNLTEGTGTSFNILLGASPTTTNSVSNAIVIGQTAAVQGNNGIAIGNNAGNGSSAGGSGAQSIAIGQSTQATNTNSIALGASASTGGFTSTSVIGVSATGTAAHQIMLGTSNETVAMPGGVTFNQSTKTSNYSLTSNDYTIFVDATSANVTLTLPDATTAANLGRVYNIARKDGTANTVTVNTTSSQTINGSLTFTAFAQYTSITLQNDGSNWYIL